MPEHTIEKIPGLRKEPLLPGHQEGTACPMEAQAEEAKGPVSKFLEEHFKHFNAATVIEAAQCYRNLLDKGGKMFLTLAGAMSTAELGISLAEMIRKNKVHAICCTGANLEEDLFNLVAHSSYLRLPSYRDLTPKEEEVLLENELARVTDTCIPEHEAMNTIEKVVREYWMEADGQGVSYFPHECLYMAIRDGRFDEDFEIDPKDSWLMAACEKQLPLFVPGWEDSTLGNIFAAWCLKGLIKDPHCIRGGIEYMMELADWYVDNSGGAGVGFFQIGGGIAGDFPICVVPMLKNDLKMDKQIPFWSYFCQISESHTSYGGYSGAVPNEKITWEKLEPNTPRFIIESDASIVAPLIFAYVLGH